VLVRLQTADHIRLASPVQEEQGPPTPSDRTWIVRFPVDEQGEAIPLHFAHCWRRIFSALLPRSLAAIAGWPPHGRTSEVFLR
jgi:hypothetical protein